MILANWLAVLEEMVEPRISQGNDSLERAQLYIKVHFTELVIFGHLLLAVLVFSPYFLYNYVLLANTDMPDFNIPMFILAKRAIQEGHLNFWNPYLLNGVSTLLSSIIPIFGVINPFNWILFLVPEDYLLLAGTFLAFVVLWLTGVVAYFLFLEEVQSQKWAFFSAVTYQLCGYTLWWSWTFELSSTWLWFTVAFYLIWTAYRRSAYLNYIFLTLVLLLLLVTSYPIAGVNMLLMVGVMALYRYFSQLKTLSHWHHLVTSGSALFTGALFFTIRLLPTWFEANQTSRIQSLALDFRDLSFLGVRLFVPEIFGVDNLSSYTTLTSILPNEKSDYGFHIHNYFPQFFGVLVALLLVWAIISPKKGATFKIWFWLGYLAVILAIILRLEPIDTIFRLLLHPVHLPMGLQVFLPLGVCVLAGLTAKTLEENKPDSTTSSSIILLVIAIGSILAYILIIWLPQFPVIISLIRPAIAAVIIILGSVWLLYRQRPATATQWLTLLNYLAIILLSVLCLYYIFLAKDSPQTFLSHLRLISISVLLLLLTYLSIRPGLTMSFKVKFYGAILILLLIISFFLMVITYPQVDTFRELITQDQNFQLILLGTARFMLVGLSFIAILRQLQRNRLQAVWIFPLFLSLLIFDLLPTGKVHNFLLSTPFHKSSNLFPSDRLHVLGEDDSPLELDIKNYRINRANAMLKLPYVLQLYGLRDYLFITGVSVYGIRAYDGYYNGIPNRYREFASNWDPNATGYSHGLYPITNPRFLDLSGVRYDYDSNSKTVKIRPKALSRFMLFTDYKVIPDDKEALLRLKNPNFAPLKTVVIDKEPNFLPIQTSQTAQKLDFTEHSTDMIELNISTETSGIVFFNDNYHPDWHVFINGVEQPVLHADYNFMGVTVPAGQSQVVFSYQPRLFYYGLVTAGAGGVLFLIIASGLYMARHRLDGPQADARPKYLRGIFSSFRTFRWVYLGFILLLLLAVAQAIFNYHEPAELFYKDFYIVYVKSKYYVLLRDKWPLDVTDGKQFSTCYQNGQCTIANSIDEAKQYVDQPIEQRLPKIAEEGYQGFNILHYQHRYYAVPQSPWLFNLLDLESWEKCRLGNNCATADTLEGVKQQITSLPPLSYNKLSSLLKSITTPSTYPTIIGERLFDWRSQQWSEFPSQLDLTFRQPVKLEGLEFDLQIDQSEEQIGQQQIVIVAGQDLKNPEYSAPLTLDFNRAEGVITFKLPVPPVKYQHYQIRFTGIQGRERPQWLTIQNTRLYVLVEEDYRGYNIHWDGNNYYILKQSQATIDLTNQDNLNQCMQNRQCIAAATLEEARQLVDKLTLQ